MHSTRLRMEAFLEVCHFTGEKKYAEIGRGAMDAALAGYRGCDQSCAFKFPYGALRAGPSLGWYAVGYEAARKTLARRLEHGGGHTGWSRAWMVNFYARLLDGDAAHQHAVLLLRKSTLPNLFDTHPPFQIDGNFAGTAGIAEMLLQSHAGTVHLLPALPQAWPDGSIRGLRARGGWEADIEWKAGKVTSYTIRATRDGVLQLRIDGKTIERPMKAGEVMRYGE